MKWLRDVDNDRYFLLDDITIVMIIEIAIVI